MTAFFQSVIDALSVGSLYALMALGIGLIFGIMRLVNFAHGELVMLGGYGHRPLVGDPKRGWGRHGAPRRSRPWPLRSSPHAEPRPAIATA